MRRLLLALAMGLLGARPAGATEAALPIASLRWIALPAAPDETEQWAGQWLATQLAATYRVRLAVHRGGPPRDGPGITVGRAAVLAAGAFTAAGLAAVRPDGFVLKANAQGIWLAGDDPPGTRFATHELLRRLGQRWYPWHGAGNVQVFTPLPDGLLPPLAVASRPFFDYRHNLDHLDRGFFGKTLPDHTVGQLGFARDQELFRGRGWLGTDHTASYLVPMGLYRAEHPEYYAMDNAGQRLPPDTPNTRVTLCLSHPEVPRIAATRAAEWMAMQPAARYFYTTDGDAGPCLCAACLARDPYPDSCTDRNLAWVNAIATAIAPRFPDNRCLALAYQGTARPPRHTAPAANVIVLFCPWHWDFTTTEEVTWANPLNLNAMRGFMAWQTRFPGQIGLYDYPGNGAEGLAGRLKFLARHGVRWWYGCGGGD